MIADKTTTNLHTNREAGFFAGTPLPEVVCVLELFWTPYFP